MFRLIGRILCALGIHKWKSDRPVTLYDMYPNPFDKDYKTPRAVCLRCGTRGEWLPGYGGSEPGCWMRIDEEMFSS